MFRVKFFLMFLLLFAFAGIKFAFVDDNISQRKVYLNESMGKVSIGLVLYYLEDKDSALKIEDILNKELQWKKSESGSLGFGFTSSSYWVRFVVVNPSKKEIKWALELDYPHINFIELYKFTGTTLIETKKAGNSLPFKNRDLLYKNFIFDQTQQPETQSIYYMRFKTAGSMDITLWAWSPILLLYEINKESLFLGMYYGFLLIISLYTFLSFLSGTNKNYLYVCLWFFGFSLYLLAVDGTSYQYLWPEAVKWESISIPFFALLAITCALQYQRYFLNIKKFIPKEDKIIKSLIILSILGMIFCLIIPLQIIIIIAILNIIYLFRLIILTRYFNKKHNPFLATRFYAAAWIVLAIGSSVFILKSIGLLSANIITNWAQRTGALLHIIFIGVAFAKSLVIINKDNKKAQIKTIETLQAAALLKDEFIEQTKKKNIEIENLNTDLIKHIEELNTAREKIAVSEEKYRILVEGSNDIIFSLDKNFKFLTMNNAIITHLRINPEKVISNSFLDLLHEGSARVSVLKQLVQEKLELFAMDKNPISFKTDFKVLFSSESKEMKVYLEYVNIEGRNEIIGKATGVEDDLLMKYVESEKQHLIFENYFITAEDISHRITRNLAKYMDHKKMHILRIALREIIINAIEHGNLNISFDEKSQLIDNDNYFVFLAERQQDPKYRNRRVEIEYSIDPQKVTYQITDEGDGFDHKKMFKEELVNVNEKLLGHGRGIPMAKNCFDEMNYNDKGNQVILIKYFT